MRMFGDGMAERDRGRETRRHAVLARLAGAGVGVALCAAIIGGCVSAGSSTGIAPGASTSGSPSGALASPSQAASAIATPGRVGVGTAPCLLATNPGALCGGSPALSPPSGEGGRPSPPPRPVPTPTPSVPHATAAAPTPPSTRSAASPIIVTTAANGTTLHLAVGQQFLLDLGSSVDWAVTLADESIVEREVGVLVVQGAQGIYAARAPGTTVLTAVGSPACASGGACPLFRLGFRLTIVVD